MHNVWILSLCLNAQYWECPCVKMHNVETRYLNIVLSLLQISASIQFQFQLGLRGYHYFQQIQPATHLPTWPLGTVVSNTRSWLLQCYLIITSRQDDSKSISRMHKVFFETHIRRQKYYQDYFKNTSKLSVQNAR